MLQNLPVTPIHPFVYIIDSPSVADLCKGYTIGMALRDSLRAIGIPQYYVLVTQDTELTLSLSQNLGKLVEQMRIMWRPPVGDAPQVNPIIHLCMHGNNNGIALTDNSFLSWENLATKLSLYPGYVGWLPLLCMASCEGASGQNMTTAYQKAFQFIVGNSAPVLQSDLTVAFLSFYHNIFNKGLMIDQAVAAMNSASSNPYFYHSSGDDIQQFRQKLLSFTIPTFNTGIKPF